MSVLSASRRTNPFSSLTKDPALLMSVIVIWFFLLLFIVYPLARLLILTFEADGHFTLGNIVSILGTKYQLKAFKNSILLGTLVGICGTSLGFLFAFTAVRANLSRGWTRFLDAAVILPLISPPFTTAIAMIFSFGHGKIRRAESDKKR